MGAGLVLRDDQTEYSGLTHQAVIFLHLYILNNNNRCQKVGLKKLDLLFSCFRYFVHFLYNDPVEQNL